jgi:hypothetical protein
MKDIYDISSATSTASSTAAELLATSTLDILATTTATSAPVFSDNNAGAATATVSTTSLLQETINAMINP